MDIKALLVRFYNGACNSEEIEYLLNHLEPGDVDEYQKVVKELWDSFLIYPDVDDEVSERMYDRIVGAAGITRSARKETFKVMYRVAAAFAGFILMAGIVWLVAYRMNETVYRTAYGEKKTILLSDSSEITLNANSSLAWKKSDFNKKSREVWIEGEAYFDIRSKNNGGRRQAFVVHANDVDVAVLGTRFNVNARRNVTKVVLEEGKVQLNVDQEEKRAVIMQPGDYVAFSGGDNKFERKIVDPLEYSSWRNDILFFNEVTLEEIAQAVEDHFGYTVYLMDHHLKQKRYKGAFPTDNLDILLESLARSFDLRVDVDGDEIWMRK